MDKEVYYMCFIIILCCVPTKTRNFYRELLIESENVCYPMHKEHKIKIETNDSVIIKQIQLNHNMAADWIVDLDCRFQVRTGSWFKRFQGENYGLIAVVHKLQLRKDPVTQKCIDFIQFHDYSGRSSPKFCGEQTPDTIHANMTANKGKIDTHIFINKHKLNGDERLDLEIVYTTFKRCYKEDLKYFKCSDAVPICISKHFVNDSYVNCPNCADEIQCGTESFFSSQYNTKHTSGLGTIAIVSGSISLLACFLIFLLCVWVCKKLKIICWSQHFSNSRVIRVPSAINRRETAIDNNITEPNSSPTPSAPPIINNSAADKDLPPAYETLFPVK